MKNILYVINSGASGGGVLSCIQEGLGFEEFGYKVKFVIGKSETDNFIKVYGWQGLECEHLIEYKSLDDLISYVERECIDICIATVFHTVKLVHEIECKVNTVSVCYYVQDYEPRFFHLNDVNYESAKASYHFGLKSFCKTAYLQNTINEKEGIHIAKVSPSMHAIFNAKGRSVSKKIRIIGMLRPDTKHRGSECLLKVYEQLNEEYGSDIELFVFGSSLSHDRHLPSYIKSIGILNSQNVAVALKSSDIFIDSSLHQGFGRVGLEAMSCGCVPVLPANNGCDEYAQHLKNSILVRANDGKKIFDGVKNIIDDQELRARLQLEGIKTAARYSVRNACLSIMDFFDTLNTPSASSKKRVLDDQSATLIVMPMMMANGLPTGSGYLRMVYPFLENSGKLLKSVKNYTGNLPTLASYSSGKKIAYFQRDGFKCSLNELTNWANLWKMAGNKIIVDIDDDLFDPKETLTRVGDFDRAVSISLKVKKIVSLADLVTCSTEWLAERALAFNKNVMVIPNKLSNKCWKFNSINKSANDKVIKIGYVGTPTHNHDLDLVEEPIKRFLSEGAGCIEFEVIGAFQNIVPPFGNKIWLPSRSEYPSFVEWLQKVQQWDVGIIPLVDDVFNKSKSNLKFLEYAALGIPIICSNVPSYHNIAENKNNCLVVDNNPSDWYGAINSLVHDSELRTQLSSNARDLILDKYILEDSVDQTMHDILERLF